MNFNTDNTGPYNLTREQLRAAGVPDDPDAPVKLETWNITIRLHFKNSTGTVQNSRDFIGRDRDTCIAAAIRELSDLHGGSTRQEVVECFQRV